MIEGAAGAPPTRQRLHNGTILDDRFEIIECLGSGNFGDVYRANQIVFGRRLREVALKLFTGRQVSETNFLDLFNDAIVVIDLQEEDPDPSVSRHIIAVYDIGLVKTPVNAAFVSMRLVPGRKTLENAVRRWQHGGMPVATSLMFLRQILRPLAWMHTLEYPVIHGDLKPDNILLRDDSVLVLTDFGLAAKLPFGTRGGAIKYQAPETLLGELGDATFDLYAVGIVWYEMLTGRHPFEDVGLEGLASGDQNAHIRAQVEARKWPVRKATGDPDADAARIVPVRELNEEMAEHPQLEQALYRCLSYRLSDRYPNARLLLRDIEEYIQGGSLGIIPNPVSDQEVDEEEIVLGTDTPEKAVQDARSLFESGDYDTALRRAEAALSKRPGFVPAMLVKARICAAMNQYREAQQIVFEAQKLAPSDPHVFETRAAIYRAQGLHEQATQMQDRAASLRVSPRR